LVLGLIFISNKISKRKQVKDRNRKWIIRLSFILGPVLGILLIFLLFNTVLNDNYNVKKGTILWYSTMTNSTVTEFPIIAPEGQASYNSLNDGGTGFVGWEVEYTSTKKNEELLPLLKNYLLEKGYKLEKVKEPKYSWNNYHSDSSTTLIAGFSKKDKCLDLTIKKLANGNSHVEALFLQ
jgi:hypothetical protein